MSLRVALDAHRDENFEMIVERRLPPPCAVGAPAPVCSVVVFGTTHSRSRAFPARHGAGSACAGRCRCSPAFRGRSGRGALRQSCARLRRQRISTRDPAPLARGSREQKATTSAQQLACSQDSNDRSAASARRRPPERERGDARRGGRAGRPGPCTQRPMRNLRRAGGAAPAAIRSSARYGIIPAGERAGDSAPPGAHGRPAQPSGRERRLILSVPGAPAPHRPRRELERDRCMHDPPGIRGRPAAR